MSIAATLSNVFRVGGTRFERVSVDSSGASIDNRVSSAEDDDEEHASRPDQNRFVRSEPVVSDIEQSEGTFVNSGPPQNTSPSSTTQQSDDVEEGRPVRSPLSFSPNFGHLSAGSGRTNNRISETEDDVEEADGLHRFAVAIANSNQQRTANMTLAELEEERELARRRSSACVLFALFVLFRLWILALQQGDFGLLLLCLIGTSWTARWIRYNQEQADELSRAIANYSENQENNNSNGSVSRNDLRMLSFQAQLALAIMESQRQMMEGGYGHPDGEHSRTPGVTAEARSNWISFAFQPEKHFHLVGNSQYGSVAEEESKKSGAKAGTDEEPHCSVCLGEYEEGEKLIKLPCGHVYHEECINSWCTNHTRCPLCNYDLNQVSATASQQSNTPEDA